MPPPHPAGTSYSRPRRLNPFENFGDWLPSVRLPFQAGSSEDGSGDGAGSGYPPILIESKAQIWPGGPTALPPVACAGIFALAPLTMLLLWVYIAFATCRGGKRVEGGAALAPAPAARASDSDGGLRRVEKADAAGTAGASSSSSSAAAAAAAAARAGSSSTAASSSTARGSSAFVSANEYCSSAADEADAISSARAQV